MSYLDALIGFGIPLFICGVIIGLFIYKKLGIKQIHREVLNRTINGLRLKASHNVFPTFTPIIRQISPMFVKIYDETTIAENYELINIIGISYGKSLEFLIRDYAIFRNPDKKDLILKARLVDCIQKYIHDGSIRSSSDIARWLRNDETHYKRKFEKADVKDLKKLINITVALINGEYEKAKIDNEIENIRKGIVE